MLVRKAQTGDGDALDQLLTLCGPTINNEIRRQQRRGVDIEDLLTPGVKAAITMIRVFDPGRGVRLITPLRTAVRNALTDYASAHRDPIRVPRRRQKSYRTADDTADLLAQKLGREPTDAELAEVLHVDIETAAELRDGAPTVESLNGHADHHRAAEQTDETYLQTVLQPHLDQLEGVERDIVQGHFFDDMTLSDLAVRHGLTRQKVTDMKNAALDRLRDPALLEQLRPLWRE